MLQMIGSCFDSDVYDLGQTAFMQVTGSGSNGKSTTVRDYRGVDRRG